MNLSFISTSPAVIFPSLTRRAFFISVIIEVKISQNRIQSRTFTDMQWSDFKFNKQIFSSIEELGVETPTPIQEKCIPLIHGGQQEIGSAPTGTGKTEAYLLTLLMKIKFAASESERALILVPAKELGLEVEETELQ